MSEWKRELSPRDKQYGHGWVSEMDRCWSKDRKYVVMSRIVNTKIGEVEHLCVRNRDNTDIEWSEKQRIKNELFGKKRTAIEVFPSEDRLIDEANMYHLWVLPDGYELPFGIHRDDMQTEPVERELMLREKADRSSLGESER